MPNPLKYKAKIVKISNHGEKIYTIHFELINGIAKFKPGQFLHLTLEDFDPTSGFWPESRVFSIASSPNSKDVEIIYSVKGRYTEKMSKVLKEGMEIWLKLPYGDFIIERHINDCSKIFIVAGGTGISPFIPFFKNGYFGKYNLPIVLFYGIRNENLYLYRDVIEPLKHKISVNIVNGLFNINDISVEIAKDMNSKCFISGPPEMINSFKKGLLLNNYPENRIIIDNWE